MTTRDFLLEINRRTHVSLASLLEHCGTLPEGAIDKKLDGFGYETIRLQIYHVIGAADYWMGVFKGDFNADELDHLYPTIESLEGYRQKVFQIAEGLLKLATDDELLTPRPMVTWGGNERTLVPAHIFMRTQTHAYHHQGQILAMCRLLGHPKSGMDYPIQ